ncbi:MAG: efflux RND transporter periplasmic adaptor subunit [Aureliella sp.]
MTLLQKLWPSRLTALTTSGLMLASLLGGAWFGRQFLGSSAASGEQAHDAQHLATSSAPSEQPAGATGESDKAGIVHLPEEQWSASSIELASPSQGEFSQPITLTGKIALNEDRVAHIFPMVEGAVESVHVQLGQQVRQNDLLVVIHSREVGQAKLELYQARLSQELSGRIDARTREIAENTRLLIAALRKGVPINDIEVEFRSRPMGDYRQQLLSAYANYYKSQADFDRLEALGSSGAVAAKQFVTAEASRNANRATFQASLEQIEHDLEQGLLQSSQTVKEAETRVAVAETNLKILGCEPDDHSQANPAEQGAAISHYPIRAPFDGTVLSKDVAILEHTRPDVQLLSIADLSTVWVTVDVYEEHLPLLPSLAGKTITVRNEAWHDRVFDAKVFYTGEIMDEASRTIALRATAVNKDGLLKPGMFVSVDLPAVGGKEVLQLPLAAIQEHEGKTFVFVYQGGDTFARRDVRVGRANTDSIEIIDGVEPGDRVAVSGGFVLKSNLLASLMGGE